MYRRRKVVAGGLFLPLLIFTGYALAQWSSDSLLNLQICDLAGDQTIPKIAATSDGGCFISWFDSRDSGYCLYLQRLNELGEVQFTEDGLLISAHTQQSWLVDYDMAVDGNDNAVVVFSDVRNPGSDLDVSAYMISSDGSFLWGPDGICLSDTTVPGFEPAPKVAVTGNGNCVFTWGRSDLEDVLIFQKISPAGDKLWGDWGISITDAAADLSSPDVVAAGEDSVIVLWKSSTGSFPMQVTHLYTQKFSDLGTGIWEDTYIQIYNSGAITPWSFPEVISDGAGGAIYSWYDAPGTSIFNSWVQHIDAEGTMLFPMNGAQASTNSTDRLHMNPSAACDGDQVFVFWVETNGNQSQFGLYGQKFSAAGDRLWTDSGLELLPLGSSQISYVRTLSDASGLYIGYLIGSVETAVGSFRTDCDGSVTWGPTTLSAASLGGKGDLGACGGYGESAYFTWQDARNESGIYAQNINQDGSMGPYLGIGSGSVQMDPLINISPSPAAGTVNISFTMKIAGFASLDVYDISGRLVKNLMSGEINQGTHMIIWDRSYPAGESSAPGMYFVRLGTSSGGITEKMILL